VILGCAFRSQLGGARASHLRTIDVLDGTSGTRREIFFWNAVYHKTLPVSLDWLTSDSGVYLDLGKVCVIAEVKINEHEMGILWKPPFRLEVSDVLKPGENLLEIRVVNLGQTA